MKAAYRWRLDSTHDLWLINPKSIDNKDISKNKPVISQKIDGKITIDRTEITEGDEVQVKTLVATLTEEEYKALFNVAVKIKEPIYNGVKFLDYSYYYDLKADGCIAQQTELINNGIILNAYATAITASNITKIEGNANIESKGPTEKNINIIYKFPEFAKKNEVVGQYLPLSGGIVTGDLTVNQTINASDATIGGGELNIDNGYINLNNESSIIVSGTSDITCTNGGSILIQSDGDISFNFSGETASRSINKNLVTLDGDGTKVVLDNGSTKALSEIGSGGTVSGDYLPLSGGIVTGKTTIQADLYANGDLIVDNGGGEVRLDNDTSLYINGGDVTFENGGQIIIDKTKLGGGDIIFKISGETASRSINEKLVTLDGDGTNVVLDDGSTKALSEIGGGGTISEDYLPLSGGTVTGDLVIKNGGNNLYIDKNGFHITNDGDAPKFNLGNNEDGNFDNAYFRETVSANTFNGSYGNFTDTVNAANGFFETSDIRLKNIIGDAKFDIDKILNLSIVYFTFKDSKEYKPQLGVIAQEIAEICPEIVSKDKDGYMSVDYAKLSLLALYCIKDLYKKIKK